MSFGFHAELTLASLVLEAVFGYPEALYRLIGHPVTWMGALLAALERRLNRAFWLDRRRRLAGVAALLILLAVSGGAALLIAPVSLLGPIGILIYIVAASSLLAQRSLHDHVQAVVTALDRDGLEAGRKAVSMIVGRNTSVLDEAGVARAAIESLAENFSDGIIAPAFWLVMAGLPGAALYKAANTADSMIGHRTPRHAAFGWAAARLDDGLNLPASRLSALFLVIAAALVGGSPGGAVRAVRRDASRHRSPNAGWPEAAMAGALGLELAGPRLYGDAMVDDAFMGDGGRRAATAADIRRALHLYRAACVVPWVILLVAVVIARG